MGVFVDSVDKVKPVGYYGFTAYAKGMKIERSIPSGK